MFLNYKLISKNLIIPFVLTIILYAWIPLVADASSTINSSNLISLTNNTNTSDNIATTTTAATATATATPIQHLIIIFQENVSFDHYFGSYPHAGSVNLRYYSPLPVI